MILNLMACHICYVIVRYICTYNMQYDIQTNSGIRTTARLNVVLLNHINIITGIYILSIIFMLRWLRYVRQKTGTKYFINALQHICGAAKYHGPHASSYERQKSLS